VGSNCTLIAQLEFAGRMAVQAFVCWNAPLTETAMEVSETPPLLVSVTVCAVESCPVMVPGKVSALTDRASWAGPARSRSAPPSAFRTRR